MLKMDSELLPAVSVQYLTDEPVIRRLAIVGRLRRGVKEKWTEDRGKTYVMKEAIGLSMR